jgi:hypothetical protein
VSRIILDPKPQRPQLPNYTEIDHPAIREAAAAWDAAKATLDSAKKSHVALEQELPQAQEDDAAADALLRSEGKPKLKGRPATQRHEKAIEEAAHEHRVAVRIEAEAFDSLQAAIDENQDEWAVSIERDVQTLDDECDAALSTFVSLHAQRSRALAIRAMVIAGNPLVADVVALRPAQIRGIDFASFQGNKTGYVPTADLFAAFGDLGKPKPSEWQCRDCGAVASETSETPTLDEGGNELDVERRCLFCDSLELDPPRAGVPQRHAAPSSGNWPGLGISSGG